MQYEGHIDVERGQELDDAVDRYNFRYRVKELIEIIDEPSVTLPNKERLRELLDASLSLVPPSSEREEEWLDHELAIERGDVVGGGPEDKEWVRRHPRD